MVVYIDVHEPKEVERYFIQFKDIEIRRQHLDVGDYLVVANGMEVPVERKDASDYVSSLESGRLHNQLYQMSTDYDLSYLIIVGSITEALLHSNINRNAYLSSLVGCSLKRSPTGKRGQIVTLMVETMSDFAGCVYFIHKKLESGDLDRRPVAVGSKSDIDSCLVTLYSCFPSVSVERAKKLAEHFPSLRAICNASVEDLMKVEGIGRKTAEKIYKFINRYYKDPTTRVLDEMVDELDKLIAGEDSASLAIDCDVYELIKDEKDEKESQRDGEYDKILGSL